MDENKSYCGCVKNWKKITEIKIEFPSEGKLNFDHKFQLRNLNKEFTAFASICFIEAIKVNAREEIEDVDEAMIATIRGTREFMQMRAFWVGIAPLN